MYIIPGPAYLQYLPLPGLSPQDIDVLRASFLDSYYPIPYYLYKGEGMKEVGSFMDYLFRSRTGGSQSCMISHTNHVIWLYG